MEVQGKKWKRESWLNDIEKVEWNVETHWRDTM